MTTLTERQRNAIEHVKWYLDTFSNKNRGTGRTTLAAHVYIQLALENPSKEIIIRDHTISRTITSDDELFRRIFDIFRSDYKQLTPLELILNYARMTIMVR